MSAAPGRGSRGRYWDDRYEQIGAERVSWFQARPNVSLALIDKLDIDPSTSVIDIGGGTSSLVDELLDRGFGDVTVLDVSGTALQIARHRLADPHGVTWLHTDVLSWIPPRRWGLWHDRAVFHFLTDPADQTDYLRRLASCLAPDGAFIIATFAPAGPEECSGLPVSRYDAETLAGAITTAVPGATIIATLDEDHTTPSGATQPFTWTAGTVTVT